MKREENTCEGGQHGWILFRDLHSDALPLLPRLSNFASLGGILQMTHPPFRLIIFFTYAFDQGI